MKDYDSDIDIDSRVKLKPEMAKVYKRARGGSIGTVKAKKMDEGFDMVYVEWDKDHWRYTGEPDGWTFENHFEPTEKTNFFKAIESPNEFAELLREKLEEEGIEDERVIDTYIDRLNEVVNTLAEAEGFIVLAAKQEPHPVEEDKQMLVPYVFGGFLDETTMTILEAQLVQMGAMAHAEMAQKMLEQLHEHDEDEEE